VDSIQEPDGSWDVSIEFKASDNLSRDFIKKGIELDMAEVYIALYTSNFKNINIVSIAALFPLSDKYGNQSDGVVYRTFLEKTEADKVNWTADKTTLKVSILPEVWTTVFLLPDFTN